MGLEGEASLVRIFIGESDRWGDVPCMRRCASGPGDGPGRGDRAARDRRVRRQLGGPYRPNPPPLRGPAHRGRARRHCGDLEAIRTEIGHAITYEADRVNPPPPGHS